MTFHLRHEWVAGATIGSMQLATCAHCKTLRITDPSRHPEPRFMQRTRDGQRNELDVAPACVEPVEHRGTAERIARMNEERAREQALRIALRDAPDEEPRRGGAD